MTIPQILTSLRPHRRISRKTLYVYLRTLKIKPAGRVRQRPQIYPLDTAARILRELGFTSNKTANGNGRHVARGR